MVKALVPTPDTGGQHWKRFHVLSIILLYMVFGDALVSPVAKKATTLITDTSCWCEAEPPSVTLS